jgi:diguanylate cyclase (GGDEF)-like protein
MVHDLMVPSPDSVKVDGARSIQEGVDCMLIQRYDCVVLDLSLPAEDDGHRLQVLYAADPTAAVVVLGGPDDDDAVIRALETGVEAHLARNHLEAPCVARTIRFAVVRKRAETERVRRALQDPLTGLHNRIAVEGFLPIALQRAERCGTRIGVVFLHLDTVEDLSAPDGRRAFDDVVLEAVRRLRLVARESDSLARLDGNTLLIVCEDLALEASVRRLSDRLREVFAEPVSLADDASAELVVTLAFAVGDGSSDPADLLRRSGGATLLNSLPSGR